jgi:hypothetical protein
MVVEKLDEQGQGDGTLARKLDVGMLGIHQVPGTSQRARSIQRPSMSVGQATRSPAGDRRDEEHEQDEGRSGSSTRRHLGGSLPQSRHDLETEVIHDGPTPLAVAAVGVYGTGPVVIHLAHGSFGAALGSLALRIGLPVVGYLAGTCLQRSNLGGMESGTVGFLVGAAGAAPLDATLLGWDRWRTSDGPADVSIVALRGEY